MPRPLRLWSLTFDLEAVSESHVTWATSVPILVFLGLCVLDLGPISATDRQTSDSIIAYFIRLRGKGIIKSEIIGTHRACRLVSRLNVCRLMFRMLFPCSSLTQTRQRRSFNDHSSGQPVQGLKWVSGHWGRMGTPFPGSPFMQSGVSIPRRALFLWERTFPGRKDSFMTGMRDIGPQWTSESEFGQDNAVTRNTGGRWKIERAHKFLQGPGIFFTVPTTLKSHFNPWTRVSWYHNVSVVDFVGAKNDGDAGETGARKSSSQIITNNEPTSHFRRPDALPVVQITVPDHWREQYRILRILSP